MMTMSSGNAIVDAVGRIGITGNVIPNSWYSAITRPNGKPYLNAIVILAEIVYWYRPTETRDEATGRTVEVKAKFKGDMLQRSYGSFAEQFGISKREATNALSALEEMGIVRRHLRNIYVRGMTLSNVLFVELVPERLMEVTHQEGAATTSKSETSNFSEGEGCTQEVTPVDAEGETYTKTSGETSLETSGRERGKRKRFTPPTRDEVAGYIHEMGYGLDPDEFMDKNEMRGWKQNNGQQIVDWKACVRMFERNRKRWASESTSSRSRNVSHGNSCSEPELVRLPYGMMPASLVKTEEEIERMTQFQRDCYYHNARTYQRNWEAEHGNE